MDEVLSQAIKQGLPSKGVTGRDGIPPIVIPLLGHIPTYLEMGLTSASTRGLLCTQQVGHQELGSRIYPLFQRSAALGGSLERAERGKPKRRPVIES